MKLDELKAAEAKLLLGTYDRYPLLFKRGEGVYLIDENGDRYLDLLSGIGVNALGYAHPAIEKAIAEQSRKLIHTFQPLLPSRPGRPRAAPNRSHRHGPRLLREQRHGSQRSRAQTRPRLGKTEARTGRASRNEVPRA